MFSKALNRVGDGQVQSLRIDSAFWLDLIVQLLFVFSLGVARLLKAKKKFQLTSLTL